MFPRECFLVGNAGGCRVDEDDECPRGTLDCRPGLECIDGHCAQPCTDHDQCASAQTCADDGECTRLPVEDTCNPLGGSCGAGQTCTATGCVTLAGGGTGELYASCDAPAQCRDGLTCATPRCLRACRRDPATRQPQTSCGVGSYCAGADTNGGPTVDAADGYCTQPCDPLASGPAAGCPTGFNCGLAMPTATVYTVCEPMAPSGGELWAPCNNQRCVAGLDCMGNVIVGVDRCFQRCESQADCDALTEICDPDLMHDVIDGNGVTRRIGGCRPRCTSAPECEERLGLEPGTATCTDNACYARR